MTIALGAVLVATFAAALCDLRTRRIPNLIPLALAVAGAMLSARAGWPGLATFAGIGAGAILLGLPLFSLRLLGGGDIKLLAAACATLGTADLKVFLLATILCGGALGIAVAARHGRLRATFANVRTMALPVLSGGPLVPVTGGIKMPYGIAIFAGAAITALVVSGSLP